MPACILHHTTCLCRVWLRVAFPSFFEITDPVCFWCFVALSFIHSSSFSFPFLCVSSFQPRRLEGFNPCAGPVHRVWVSNRKFRGCGHVSVFPAHLSSQHHDHQLPHRVPFLFSFSLFSIDSFFLSSFRRLIPMTYQRTTGFCTPSSSGICSSCLAPSLPPHRTRFDQRMVWRCGQRCPRSEQQGCRAVGVATDCRGGLGRRVHVVLTFFDIPSISCTRCSIPLTSTSALVLPGFACHDHVDIPLVPMRSVE